MKLVWRIVITVALILIFLGMAAMLVGFFTGASLERMIEMAFGSREFFEMILHEIRDTFQRL